MLSKFKNFKSVSLLLTIVFVGMYFLTRATPLVLDDTDLSVKILGYTTKISNLRDIIQSQIAYYIQWGGRTQALDQFFLWQPQVYFNVMNALIFVLVLIMIYMNLDENLRKEKPLFTYIMILNLVWFGIPKFWQTILWRTGATNYLWTSLAILVLVCVLKKILINEMGEKKILGNFEWLFLILLGFFAGWTNENISLSLVVVFSIFYYKKRKEINNVNKSRAKKLLISFYFGFVVLFAAPGNYVRSALLSVQGKKLGCVRFIDGREFDRSISIFQNIKDRIGELSISYIEKKVNIQEVFLWQLGRFKNVFIELLPILLILIVCIISLYLLKKKETHKIIKKHCLEGVLGIFSIGILVLFFGFEPRATFGSSIFLIIFTMNILLEIFNIGFNKYIPWLSEKNIAILLCIVLIGDYVLKLFGYFSFLG